MNRRHNPEGSSGMAKGDLQLPTSIPGWSYRSEEAAKDAFAPGEYCSEFCFTKVRLNLLLNCATTDHRRLGQQRLFRPPSGQRRRSIF
jgi:hypothetical protein